MKRAPQPCRYLGRVRLLLRIVALGACEIRVVVELLVMFAATQHVERFVDRDAVDPAEEFVVRIVFVQPLRNSQENDLGDVARILGPAQHPERGVVDRSLVPDHQLREGLPVALPEALHESFVGVVVHSYTWPRERLVAISGSRA